MPRRNGRPGLVGAMARTAVIAGTATAVSGSMRNKQQAGAQAAAAQQASQQQAQQTAMQSQAQLAEMQAQLDAVKAQQAPPAPAAAPADDVMAKLQRLADLKAAGVLDDAEFSAAKAQLLGI